MREKKIGTWRDGLRDIIQCLHAKREAMTERDPKLSEKVRTFFEERKKNAGDGYTVNINFELQ